MALRLEDGSFVRWNEQMAARFDPQAFHHHPNPLIRAIEARRVRALVELLRLRPGARVLEVGCGPGDVLLALPTTLQRHGLDLSTGLLARASARLGPAVPLLRGDAARLPLAGDCLDGVVCSEVLEHVLQPAAVLAELARVLRPGGRAVVSVPEEARIDRLKDVAWRLGLARLLRLGGGPAPTDAPPPDVVGADPEGYAMARRMDDAWHLHRFSLELLRSLLPPTLVEERVLSVPARWLPLRRVVALRRR